MKKILMLLVIGFLFFGFSSANATLLGIREYAGVVPDINWDAGGLMTYDNNTDIFHVLANDIALYFVKPSAGIPLLNRVDFQLTAIVDANGNLVQNSRNLMVERVIADFEFEWKGTIYTFAAGDIFLSGPVIAMGWDNSLSYLRFDWVFTPMSGKMVDYTLWPSIPTGAYGDSINKTWNAWNEDLSVLTEKGDKYPVPEPATMLLLGSGLIGLAGYARKRFKK